MTKKPPIVVRDVTDADMARIQEIYAHHVLTGGGSFEQVPPDTAEMTRRRDAVRAEGYPYIIAEIDGLVVGYAYAGRYRPRPAYLYSVENSVYVDQQAHRRGIGVALLTELIDRCTAAGYRQMVAVIGDSENHGSIRLHRKMGFHQVGIVEAIGFKFGRWLDSVIMQRPLGPGADTKPDGPPEKN